VTHSYDALLRVSSGNVIQTKTSAINSLAPGSSATASLDQPITNALAPGTYTITTAVTDANGVAVANNSSTFTIASTATTGSGISGTITTPATVQQNASLSINITITNDGNAALANAQFSVQLVDGATVVATLPFTLSVANGASATKTLAYDTTGLAPKSYALRLVCNITTTPRTLAILNSTVTSATQLSLSIATSATPRVLIFSNCSSGNSSKGCAAVTPAFLTRTLTAAAISWNVVGDEDSFLAAMRSGGYSAAIIDQPKSAELKIADEYLAIVHAGFGLLFIDNDPNAMPKLSPALQTTFGGKLHGPTLLDIAATPFTGAGTLTLNGDTTALQLAGATAAARIKSTQAPAITYATYGSGRVVVLPFDVESTPTTDVAKLLTNATSYVSRVPSKDARQVVPVALDVTTPAGGGALNLELALTLPDGISVVATSPQSSPATSARWTFTAQAGTTSRFIVWLRLPETEGSYVVNAALGFTGQLPLLTKQLTLDVTAARTALETTLSTQLAALQSHATAKEQKSITDMQAKLDASRVAATPDAGTIAANITRMLDILDGLTALSLDTTNARAGAERLLMYWQSRS
jgi:hypothetical protein